MYFKFIKLIELLSLLVCCGFAGRVLYGRFPQLCRTRERSTSHFGVRSGTIFPWSFSSCITQMQRRNTLILGISMAEKSFDYKSWRLEQRRAEARKRFTLFTQKDGVKTLASKLRTHDRLMPEKEPNTEEKADYEETPDEEKASDLTFDQRLQLLQLERQIRIEEREKHVELVGVLDKLPVDCLLGRSSFGQTLSKENLLKQWERNVSDNDCKINEAFVLTRGQKALQDAQRRADALIDRENSLAVETLSKKETRQHGLKQGDLPTLFGDRKPGETSDESLVCNTDIASTENEPPINILDRNKTQLAADQNADVTLDRVRRGVSEKAPEECDGYFFQGGILMHRRFIEAEHNGTRYVDRIVVPESYRNEILRVAHTIPLSGHMAFAKTLDRIGAHFFWPGLSSDVRKFCATCPQCQLLARKLKSHRAPLRPVEVVTEPFKKIAIDIVGELPRSTSGYKYILTIVDYATRYPEAIPLRTTNSKAIADALIQYFSKVGIPDEIVTDQGSNFMSKLIAQLYEQLGINKIKTSIYHPQANG